jgi:hypothetical protein
VEHDDQSPVSRKVKVLRIEQIVVMILWMMVLIFDSKLFPIWWQREIPIVVSVSCQMSLCGVSGVKVGHFFGIK